MHLAIGRQPNGLPAAITQIPGIIESLGEGDFGARLISLLADLCDADHCTVFKITEKSPLDIVAVSRDGTDTALQQSKIYLSGSYWRFDAPMTKAMECVKTSQTSIFQSEIRSITNVELRNRIYRNAHIRDRILLCGGTPEQFVGISILRSDDGVPLAEDGLLHLEALADTLVALVSKHASLIDTTKKLSMALTSLTEIEAALHSSYANLPKREAEVCARILYGMSSAGIASDLEIGEETVATYRKRAYQRLGIATQRELLIWHLNQWGSNRAKISGPARPLNKIPNIH